MKGTKDKKKMDECKHSPSLQRQLMKLPPTDITVTLGLQAASRLLCSISHTPTYSFDTYTCMILWPR